MQTRKLGNSDLELSPVGFGTWAIGGDDWGMGWGPQEDADSIAAIHEALECGVNWIDTAHAYGFGKSEEVVGRALKEWSGEVIIATKCGVLPNEVRFPYRDANREAIRLSAALGAESAFVNGAVKSLFRRERPAHEVERPHNLRQPLTSSFPSGHASAAFLAATLLSERSRIKPFWYAAAGVVAVSRVHVRIHHASDVVVGAGIGLAFGRLIRKVLPLR